MTLALSFLAGAAVALLLGPVFYTVGTIGRMVLTELFSFGK
jgi:hypothetical protein